MKVGIDYLTGLTIYCEKGPLKKKIGCILMISFSFVYCFVQTQSKAS